ncbi:MAG: hypothetical protein JWO18_2675 [Microbacteriaceae bacterium]|nr:hypothetical protein [Microbacteriaceae bacterium]
MPSKTDRDVGGRSARVTIDTVTLDHFVNERLSNDERTRAHEGTGSFSASAWSCAGIWSRPSFHWTACGSVISPTQRP